MHILSGIFLFVCTDGWAATVSFDISDPYAAAHALLYAHSWFATATAFHLSGIRKKNFLSIRVFGTLGWIAAGIIVSYLLQADTTAVPMYVAGGASLLMGLYSFPCRTFHPVEQVERLQFEISLGSMY